jgi:hypothetical protein
MVHLAYNSRMDDERYVELVLKPIQIELDQLKYQVASLSELIQSLDSRLDQLEKHASIGAWLMRQSLIIGTALLIGWLSGVLRI